MSDWRGKRYWLVGASEGLGRAVAEKISRAGADVVLSARNMDRLQALAATLPGKAQTLAVDVSDSESVSAAARAIGDIDGVVYLAAVYWTMSAQDWDAKHVEAMCDINFVGAARVLGAVLPGMIARDAGHVVLTGSLSGFRGLPGAIGYGASKAGVMYLAESLHADLRATNIDVQLINPGFIKTRLTEKNKFAMPFIMTPEDAAQEFFEHMNGDGFKKNYPRLFGLAFRLSQFLPDWIYYRVFGGSAGKRG